ncbi:PorT family protein [Marivirga sp. S37H4]|uniref:PorT family protein n=1 Tax=Marivirga aurantiaca TaxID=2802615 RepID=A0A935C9B0_9BACT|nr:porin family protein [Marivirga aurantiaca]MBK6266066.1 PorT family protein [Marivirga aurantiaca]
MKIYLIAIIAAIMVTTTVQAQNANIGIKGGLNLYNVINENSSDGDLKAGFHLGLIGHFHLNEQFALQPEVVFSTQGSDFTSNNTEMKLNLNYVNVPVLIQYMFNNGFRLQAGPQVGVLVSAKGEVNDSNVDLTDDYNSIDLGASFGVGYINPSSNFGFDARYNMGLTDINESTNENSYNRGYQIGVFYLFNHK